VAIAGDDEPVPMLQLQRGWPPERYGRWLAASLTAALLL
jgi:hypothetical protein